MSNQDPMRLCEIWPGRAVGLVFAQHLASLGRPPTVDDYVEFGFEQQLEQFYANNQRVVPLLNDRPTGFLPQSCLIKVRGMIQSVADPEFYLAAYEEHDKARRLVSKRTAKYIESLTTPPYLSNKFDQSSISERLPAYLIPVPCETKWARKLSYPAASHNDFFAHLNRRPIPPKLTPDGMPEVRRRVKRHRDEVMDVFQESGSGGAEMTEDGANEVEEPKKEDLEVSLEYEDVVDRQAPKLEDEQMATHRLAAGLNYPVPDNFGTAVWAKFYPPSNNIKTNDLVECLGIITEPPAMTQKVYGNHTPLDELPVPFAPRYHVVLMNNLGEGNPIIPSAIGEREEHRNLIYSQLESLRAGLIDWMTRVLGGDTLAAEYFLYNIIAKPVFRDGESQAVVGHIPLNFIIPAESANGGSIPANTLPMSLGNPKWTHSVLTRIEHALETLFPKRHTISLTRDELDSRNLVPFISPESGRLESGTLQLPSGTHVLVDETKWSPELGSPSPKHHALLEHVSTFIHQQHVHYDLINYTLPYQVDCPTLVLSQGKSIFEISCAFPIQCQLDIPPPPHVPEETLNLWRAMIGYMRLAEWPGQSEQVLSAIEDDFVAIRGMGNDYLTPELFATWNALARASTISHGQDTLSEDVWANVKEMESLRLQRL